MLGDLCISHYDGIKAHVEFLARQSEYGDGVPQFGLLGDCELRTAAFFNFCLTFICSVDKRTASEFQ